MINLTNLFSLKERNSGPQDNIKLDDSTASDAIRTGETYEMWGTRVCGIVSGSNYSLPPYLQKVHNHIYGEQLKNQELQESLQKQIQADIEQKQNELRAEQDKLVNTTKKIDKIKSDISELKDEYRELNNSKERVNKDKKMKLIIGLIILIPLTFYLFLFYSSTFYSAFFQSAEQIDSVMSSMFNPHALANAWNDGIPELSFVLSAPIIFLGLGFCLHFFSVQEKWTKYLKMFGILAVTVMFDCILAYKIGEQLHEITIMTGAAPVGQEYTISLAIHDINTWAVIFCGFIVYIIWGIVFDMSMSAYQAMDLNRTRMKEIDTLIKQKKNDIDKLDAIIEEINDKITKLNNDISKRTSDLSKKVNIDYGEICKEMNNFFTGWIKQMKVLCMSQVDQQRATQTFNTMLSNISSSKEYETKVS